jgi:hypothetical protein
VPCRYVLYCAILSTLCSFFMKSYMSTYVLKVDLYGLDPVFMAGPRPLDKHTQKPGCHNGGPSLVADTFNTHHFGLYQSNFHFVVLNYSLFLFVAKISAVGSELLINQRTNDLIFRIAFLIRLWNRINSGLRPSGL